MRRLASVAVRFVWIAAIPLLAELALLAIDGRSRLWSGLSPSAAARLASNRLIAEIVLVVVAAPIIGVRLALRKRSWAVALPIAAGATVLAATSAALSIAVLRSLPAETVAPLVASHVTLWAATVACAAVGALCASICSHPLDAALVALLVAVVGGGATLLAGPSMADAPAAVIDAALLASPVVATAAAGNIDLFRTPVVYRLSPIAHIGVNYPAWPAAFAWQAVVALACFALMVMNFRRQTRRLKRITL